MMKIFSSDALQFLGSLLMLLGLYAIAAFTTTQATPTYALVDANHGPVDAARAIVVTTLSAGVYYDHLLYYIVYNDVDHYVTDISIVDRHRHGRLGDVVCQTLVAQRRVAHLCARRCARRRCGGCIWLHGGRTMGNIVVSLCLFSFF